LTLPTGQLSKYGSLPLSYAKTSTRHFTTIFFKLVTLVFIIHKI
jgi:hypothetical protein